MSHSGVGGLVRGVMRCYVPELQLSVGEMPCSMTASPRTKEIIRGGFVRGIHIGSANRASGEHALLFKGILVYIISFGEYMQHNFLYPQSWDSLIVNKYPHSALINAHLGVPIAGNISG